MRPRTRTEKATEKRGLGGARFEKTSLSRVPGNVRCVWWQKEKRHNVLFPLCVQRGCLHPSPFTELKVGSVFGPGPRLHSSTGGRAAGTPGTPTRGRGTSTSTNTDKSAAPRICAAYPCRAFRGGMRGGGAGSAPRARCAWRRAASRDPPPPVATGRNRAAAQPSPPRCGDATDASGKSGWGTGGGVDRLRSDITCASRSDGVTGFGLRFSTSPTCTDG